MEIIKIIKSYLKTYFWVIVIGCGFYVGGFALGYNELPTDNKTLLVSMIIWGVGAVIVELLSYLKFPNQNKEDVEDGRKQE